MATKTKPKKPPVQTPPVEEMANIYQPAERLIYQYWDGQQTIKADPMVLYKAVSEVGPELSIAIKVSRSASKDASKAHNELVEKVRGIFNLKPFNDGGLTELESIELLDHFMAYVNGVKKNSSLSSMSSESSAASPASTDADPTIPNSSDSGSTAVASSTETPMPLPSEPGSPLG